MAKVSSKAKPLGPPVNVSDKRKPHFTRGRPAKSRVRPRKRLFPRRNRRRARNRRSGVKF